MNLMLYKQIIRGPRTTSQNVINSKWVFKVKEDHEGKVDRFKARLVANGMRQRKGLDYDDTFSPVVKQVSIRLVLTIATSLNWKMHQLDVSNAFLHGFLKEDVYMSQPQGFIDHTRPSHVCKLKRALYGLKQSPRMWFHRLKEFLLSMGFLGSLSDPSLFVYKDHDKLVYILVYVDDIIVTGSDETLVDGFIRKLGAVRNLGSLRYFLGIHVRHSPTGVHLNQRNYAINLLRGSGFENLKPAITPMEVRASLWRYHFFPCRISTGRFSISL